MHRSTVILIAGLCLLTGCTRRDFLTRGLAADLINASDTFKAPQQFFLRTGVVSNREYGSPEYLVLQRRGWVTGVTVPCTADVAPPPCWDVALTPIGVETFRDLIPNDASSKQYFPVVVAKRQLVGVTGISREGNRAEVDFTWKWAPSNEVGSALVASLDYKTSVAFRHYDDGWRVVDGAGTKPDHNLEEALRDANPAQ